MAHKPKEELPHSSKTSDRIQVTRGSASACKPAVFQRKKIKWMKESALLSKDTGFQTTCRYCTSAVGCAAAAGTQHALHGDGPCHPPADGPAAGTLRVTRKVSPARCLQDLVQTGSGPKEQLPQGTDNRRTTFLTLVFCFQVCGSFPILQSGLHGQEQPPCLLTRTRGQQYLPAAANAKGRSCAGAFQCQENG